MFHLSPADTTDEYWRERLTIFTAAQKHAIYEYVHSMQSEPVNKDYDEHLTRAMTVWRISK